MLEMKGLIPFTIVCLVAAWWAKNMFQLLLEQIPWFQGEKKKPALQQEPTLGGITVEKLEEAAPVTATSMTGPRPVERFVATPATPADRRSAKKARRKRAARRPGKFIARGRVGRFITVTYKVDGELATRCWDSRNLEAFWLPGSPAVDPALAGFLEGRKALPPAD